MEISVLVTERDDESYVQMQQDVRKGGLCHVGLASLEL
jgi:hypothetical protein